jgi:hypothetical protein
VWHSFLTSPVLLITVPRKTFGAIQGNLFPVYFMFSSLMLATAVNTRRSLLLRTGVSKTDAHTTMLLIALALSLANLLLLGPQNTDVLQQRSKLSHELDVDAHDKKALKERAEQDKGKDERAELIIKLNKKFGMYHGMSMLANGLTMIAGLLYFTHLASGLAVA